MTPEELAEKLKNMVTHGRTGWPLMRDELELIRQAAEMIDQLNARLKDAMKTLDEKWTDQ